MRIFEPVPGLFNKLKTSSVSLFKRLWFRNSTSFPQKSIDFRDVEKYIIILIRFYKFLIF